MIGKTLTLAAMVLFSTQVLAQTTQGSANPGQGITSGPASGSPATMTSPHAGPPETKHQGQVIHQQSRSVRTKQKQSARRGNDDGGATGSSSPIYAPPPR